MHSLTLSILPGVYAVCRLPADQPIPSWALRGPFFTITRTAEELSLVCPDPDVPAHATAERGWRILKVEGPLDFSLTGILARLSGALAQAQISLFAVSTYDTDYLLVRASDLERAAVALAAAGCIVTPAPATGSTAGVDSASPHLPTG